MKGKNMVSIGMSGCKLGAEGAKAVAELVSATGSLTELYLQENQLCGVNRWCQGTYTAEGIIALADALKAAGSITWLDVRENGLADPYPTRGQEVLKKAVEGRS